MQRPVNRRVYLSFREIPDARGQHIRMLPILAKSVRPVFASRLSTAIR